MRVSTNPSSNNAAHPETKPGSRVNQRTANNRKWARIAFSANLQHKQIYHTMTIDYCTEGQKQMHYTMTILTVH